MRLKTLISFLDNCQIDADATDFEVAGIAGNSKSVRPDFVFVAVKGAQEDGHRFIPEAIENGAQAIVIQDAQMRLAGNTQRLTAGKKVAVIAVADTRQALARLSAAFYHFPSRAVKVVGITGTNGKTTISYLIESILKEAGINCAVIGTINYRFKDKVFPSGNTTPGPLELQAMLAEMVRGGVPYAVIEVSSHALDQERTAGINFHSAIFTNLTQDHLDYHLDIESYFQAKSKLFRDIDKTSFVALNQDDRYNQRLKGLTPAKIITYGIENNADVMAKDIKYALLETEFLLSTFKGESRIKTSLIGRHNVYNILSGVAWALAQNLDLSLVKSAVEKFNTVPGRLERIQGNGDFCVFVDYAHTEDALKNAISALRQVSAKRIIVVFGCGGERDKAKRPKMGTVVSELADYAIVTNDNPRHEDPLEIINDIKRGITKDNFCVVAERREAIKKSLSLARPGDIVLVAGKGHESYQIVQDERIHFDDREVVRECLKAMNC